MKGGESCFEHSLSGNFPESAESIKQTVARKRHRFVRNFYTAMRCLYYRLVVERAGYRPRW